MSFIDELEEEAEARKNEKKWYTLLWHGTSEKTAKNLNKKGLEPGTGAWQIGRLGADLRNKDADFLADLAAVHADPTSVFYSSGFGSDVGGGHGRKSGNPADLYKKLSPLSGISSPADLSPTGTTRDQVDQVFQTIRDKTSLPPDKLDFYQERADARLGVAFVAPSAYYAHSYSTGGLVAAPFPVEETMTPLLEKFARGDYIQPLPTRERGGRGVTFAKDPTADPISLESPHLDYPGYRHFLPDEITLPSTSYGWSDSRKLFNKLGMSFDRDTEQAAADPKKEYPRWDQYDYLYAKIDPEFVQEVIADNKKGSRPDPEMWGNFFSETTRKNEKWAIIDTATIPVNRSIGYTTGAWQDFGMAQDVRLGEEEDDEILFQPRDIDDEIIRRQMEREEPDWETLFRKNDGDEEWVLEGNAFAASADLHYPTGKERMCGKAIAKLVGKTVPLGVTHASGPDLPAELIVGTYKVTGYDPHKQRDRAEIRINRKQLAAYFTRMGESDWVTPQLQKWAAVPLSSAYYCTVKDGLQLDFDFRSVSIVKRPNCGEPHCTAKLVSA